MKTSSTGIKLIQTFEGCVLHAYRDPANILTIGYGHTGNVKEGSTITQSNANELLKEDLAKFEKGVADLVKVSLNQNQFDALVSFSYNLGLGNLKSSTLLKKLNTKDYNGAANEFTKWVYAAGKKLDGLVKRRKAEKDLFLKAIPKPTTKEHIINYKVKKNENLTVISKRYNTTVERILKLNPDITNKNLIFPNQLIKVPDNR